MEMWSGSVAIVTGGASGLGAATATALADAGLQVALFDLNEAAGEAHAAALGGSFHKVDVSDAASVAAGMDAVSDAAGAPRVLVNCAGIGPASKTVSRGEPHDPAMFAKVIGINPALDHFRGVAGVLFPILAKMLAAVPFTARLSCSHPRGRQALSRSKCATLARLG